MKNEFIIIRTTFAKISEAKKVAKILLEKKLAACVQFSKIDSLFYWNEKIENCQEILVEIKTEKKFYKKIEKEILAYHPYEIAEILALKIYCGSDKYLRWIKKKQ